MANHNPLIPAEHQIDALISDLCLTRPEARELTDEIKAADGSQWDRVVRAYCGRAWIALGYRDWEHYRATEFADCRLRIPREEQSEIVKSLRGQGLSIRGIESTTGLSHGTVQREVEAARREVEVSGVSPGTPGAAERPGIPPVVTRVKGGDGKSHPARKRKPQKSESQRITEYVAQLGRALSTLTNYVEILKILAADPLFAAAREVIEREHGTQLSNITMMLATITNKVNASSSEELSR